MFATYPIQAQNLTDIGVHLPANFMTSFDPLPVMVIVPAIEIYFMCAKRRNLRHLEIHPLKRIGNYTKVAQSSLVARQGMFFLDPSVIVKH
jgi:hypothetical protein